jgi:hypothetical protein
MTTNNSALQSSALKLALVGKNTKSEEGQEEGCSQVSARNLNRQECLRNFCYPSVPGKLVWGLVGSKCVLLHYDVRLLLPLGLEPKPPKP